MLGEVIHGYRVERALSADKGGFGDVYFATHVGSGAEAVVKVLKPEMSAKHDIVTRFFNEARAAASVHHPGIVQIHNVGYHGDRAYLLMERLRGDDLETRLQGGPLPVDRALVFVRQAAGAVGAAHERGIVHRDLKPANLFVVRDPDVAGGERVKVLDFGIAKLTTDAGAGKTQGVFGTPSYMSPEQCSSTGAVDGRADLYSLGCILYELVTGRPPFGHGGLEVIAAHLRDAPMPPRAIAPWVPPAVEQIALRLLEKQPERRYGSCAELVAAIDQAAAGVMPSGPTPSTSPTAPTFANAATAPSSWPPITGRPGEPTRSVPPSSAVFSSGPTAPRGRGLAIGLAVGVLAIGGIATAVVMSRGAKPPPPGNGSQVAAAPADAAAPPDATQVAAAPPIDAALPIDAAQPIDAPPPIDAAPPVDAAPRQQHRDAGVKAPPVERPPTSTLDDVAERLNEEGKELMYSSKYAEAADKFRQATARIPKAKFAINLCVAQLQSGRLQDAMNTCRTIEALGPTADQQRKSSMLLEKIVSEAKRQNIELR